MHITTFTATCSINVKIIDNSQHSDKSVLSSEKAKDLLKYATVCRVPIFLYGMELWTLLENECFWNVDISSHNVHIRTEKSQKLSFERNGFKITNISHN